MTAERGMKRRLPRSYGTFLAVNRKYQQRSAAQQWRSEVEEIIMNNGGNPGDFYLHLFVTNRLMANE
jgi:hypothetical protein